MKQKLLYWIPHTLLLLLMVGSAIMYFLLPVETAATFVFLGYEPYTMYINAFAKLVGGIMILCPAPAFLKHFSYAGYLYIMILAFAAILKHPQPDMPAYMTFIMFGIFFAIWGMAYTQFYKCKCARI